MGKLSRAGSGKVAFTLLECLVAMALLGLILATGLRMLATGLEARRAALEQRRLGEAWAQVERFWREGGDALVMAVRTAPGGWDLVGMPSSEWIPEDWDTERSVTSSLWRRREAEGAGGRFRLVETMRRPGSGWNRWCASPSMKPLTEED